MTKTAAKKAEAAARKLALLSPAALSERLAAESHAYCHQWCDPVAYRRVWQREWRANVAEMRAQRLDRIKRRDDLIAWLLQYETWREEHDRPIAYCRRAPAPAEEAQAA